MDQPLKPAFTAKPSTWPYALVAAVYLLLYAGLDLLSMRFSVSTGVSVWYPPVGLDVALLLGFGLRYLPLTFLGNVLHTWIVPGDYNWADYLVPIVLGNGVYGLAVWLLNRLNINRYLSRFQDVYWFMLVGGFAGSLVAAVSQSLGLIAAGRLASAHRMLDIASFWAGDGTGIVVMAPLILGVLGWLERTEARPKEVAKLRQSFYQQWIANYEIWRSLGQLLLMGISLWFAFGNRLLGFNYQYLVFIPIVMYAVQRGYSGALFAVVAINAVAVVLAYSQIHQPDDLSGFQFCLAVASYIAVLLGAIFREQRQTEERIRELALFDPLTGLLNRAGFTERLSEKLAVAPAGKMALITFDLNHFRSIAASRGNAFTNQLLQRLGERIRLFTGAYMSSARFEGDSFAIALERVANPTTAQAKAENLHYHLSQPLLVDGEEVRPSLSFGVALNLSQGELPDSLFRRADTARLWVKTVGEGQVVLFDPSFADQPDHLSLERDMRAAIERREFVPYYQPILDLKSNQIKGLEVLARWDNPQRGLINPTEFIPMAEETGLIVPLSQTLLWQAFADLYHLQNQGFYNLSLHLNLSAKLLLEPNLVNQLAAVLREYEIAPNRVILEITESFLVDEAKQYQQLQALHALGIALAMDDFGTGYSSMLSLKRLPVRVLKIDRSFLVDVPDNRFDSEMVATILSFAENMGLTVVVEGVENLSQHQFLLQNGAPEVQGFLYAKPMPLAETERHLKDHRGLATRQ